MVADGQEIPVVRQCELLELARSSLYYRPHCDPAAAAFEQQLLNAIDEQRRQRAQQRAQQRKRGTSPAQSR